MNWKTILAFIFKWAKKLLEYYLSTKATTKVALPDNNKEIGLAYLMCFVGRWYKWGSNGPATFDCSGLACEYLKAIGKMKRKDDKNADMLWNEFSYARVPSPGRGCLVLFGTGKATHVEIMLNNQLSIGASGGGSATVTVEDAIRDNAFIKIRSIDGRTDTLGYIDPTLIK